MKYIKIYESAIDTTLFYLKDIFNYISKEKKYEFLKGFKKYKKNTKILFQVKRNDETQFIEKSYNLNVTGILTFTENTLNLNRTVSSNLYFYKYIILDIDDLKIALLKSETSKEDWIKYTENLKHKIIRKEVIFSKKYTGNNIKKLIEFLEKNEFFLFLTYDEITHFSKDIDFEKTEFIEFFNNLIKKHDITKLLPIIKSFYNESLIKKYWPMYNSLEDFGFFD